MTPAVVIPIAIAAFLFGVVTAAFVILVASIHAAGRHQHLTTAPDGHLDALTRNLLGVGVRTDHLASPRDDEEN